ncbi:MAG: YvcK family protein [Thermoleophilaceae bacterium]|nr:YvcK family protein [Thermoleophilaceae bacterium]
MGLVAMRVALLAGGTGGAKLAVGLRDILHGFDGQAPEQPGQLSVVANTADDIEIYDVHVSPDPDLISFRLAGVIDGVGFGIEGEGHELMDARRAAGEQIWFELGDDDMRVCAERAALLAAGETLTAAHAGATARYDAGGALVLPMSDRPVRTIIETPEGPRGIQQFLIQDRSDPTIVSVRFEGIDAAAVTAPVDQAVSDADLIVIGPSNPVISISPILRTPGMAEALSAAEAPVLAVSPFVGGAVLKGPTAKFVESAGFPATSSGVADYYAEAHGALIDAWIADDPLPGHAHHLANVAMSDPARTRSVAAEVLRYGASLPGTRSD